MGGKRFRYASLFLAALFLAVAGLAFQGTERTDAAPNGAAMNLHVVQQSCASDGSITASFAWSPSGLGTQWFDVSTSNFQSGWWPFGPYNASKSSLQIFKLQRNVTYQIRVTTFDGSGYLASDTLAFLPTACGGSTSFTPPTNFTASASGSNTVFNWTRGSDNAFFCVDTAFNPIDLTTISGSWHNWGCGTAGTSLSVSSLQCGTLHYARVWAVGATGSGYSNTVNFVTPPCPFTPPSNPNAQVQGPNTVTFSWTRGVNNSWFCIDTAFNSSDLVNLTGSWGNHGCGTLGTTFTANNLVCGQTHYYRIYAAGISGGNGYSQIGTFTTPACTYGAPYNLTADVQGPNTVEFDWSRGTSNVWFCVETAKSMSDLTSLSDTWENHGCGTTASQLTVDSLDCGTTYYWRVFAWTAQGGVYSDVSTATTDPCVTFTAPTNLTAEAQGSTSVYFDWDRGTNNTSFCVDTATSLSDLTSKTGSYHEYGCGTTSSHLTVNSLTCDTTYYWRVYATGPNGNGYSDSSTVTTDSC